MALKDLEFLKAQLLQDVRAFADSGYKIVERTGTPDASSMRAAANQFRQAASALDQLDGINRTEYYLRSK